MSRRKDPECATPRSQLTRYPTPRRSASGASLYCSAARRSRAPVSGAHVADKCLGRPGYSPAESWAGVVRPGRGRAARRLLMDDNTLHDLTWLVVALDPEHTREYVDTPWAATDTAPRARTGRPAKALVSVETILGLSDYASWCRPVGRRRRRCLRRLRVACRPSQDSRPI